MTLLGCGSSSTVLVCMRAALTPPVGCRIDEGGDDTETELVVDSKSPAESTDCGAGDAPVIMSNPPILSR